MKKGLVLLLILGTWRIPSKGQAQYNWNEKAQQIYEAVTSLKIPEARKQIAIEKKASPNNLVLPLLESYADFYELFLNEDITIYQQLEPQFEKKIQQFEKISYSHQKMALLVILHFMMNV